jgi:hypothetical protein
MIEEIKEVAFTPHIISKSINKDFNSILNSPEMAEFKEGLQYKSAISRAKDERLMNLLLNRLTLYKKGWIQANALSTSELFSKSQAIDKTYLELSEVSDNLNDMINQIIIMFKESIPEEKLNQLRDLERNIKQIQL